MSKSLYKSRHIVLSVAINLTFSSGEPTLRRTASTLEKEKLTLKTTQLKHSV